MRIIQLFIVATLMIHHTIIPVCPAGTIPVDLSNSDYHQFRNNALTACYDQATNTVTFAQFNIPPIKNVQKICPAVTSNPGNYLIGTIKVTAADNTTQTCSLWSPTPEQAMSNYLQAQNNVSAVANVLFNPVVKKSDGSTTPNPYATTSINEQAIIATLQAIGADATLITLYKQFYFYLEYATRVDLAGRMAVLAKNKSIDMISTIEKSSWSGFIDQMVQTFGSWENLEKACFSQVTEPNYLMLMSTLQPTTWQELVKTPFWKSIKITSDTIANSTFWQDYLKYDICNSFAQDQLLLTSIKQTEETLFKYLPNLEVAFYQTEFKSLRTASEIFHLKLILNDAARLRILPACNEWKTIKDAQGNYDLKKIHDASATFRQSDFFQIAQYAQNNTTNIIDTMAQNKLPISVQEVSQKYFFQESLTLLAMIKNLQALTQTYFDKTHLDKTMQVLGNTSIKKPSPSILLFDVDDTVFLDDLNNVQSSIVQKAAQPMMTAPKLAALSVKQMTEKAIVQNWLSDAWNAVKDAGEAAIEEAGDIAESAYHAARTAFKKVDHFLTGVAPDVAIALLNKSKDLTNDLINDIEAGAKDLEHIAKAVVNFVGDIPEDLKWLSNKISEGINSACDFFKSDKELCGAVGGVFKTIVDMAITKLDEIKDLTKTIGGGLVQLTEDAIHTCAKVATDVITGHYSDLGHDLVKGLKDVAMDIGTTILSTLTLEFKYFVEQLMNAFKLVQYIISITVRIFIDATTAVVYAMTSLLDAVGVPGINPMADAAKVNSWLGQHERVIGAAITTAILVAAIPFTDGMSLGLLVMTVGPQLFDILGSFQQDELIHQQKKDEEEFVKTFSTYVENNKIIYQQQQAEWADELNLKYQSQLSNQERGLGFFHTFMDTSFQGLKSHFSHLLGSYWSVMLTPTGDYNTVPADLGTIYGITTKTYNLNPSQGFSLYSNARQSFSQEIAVAPAIIPNPQQPTQIQTKNWFNQKDTFILDDDIQDAEIAFRALYTLPEFHIGLYFGGQFIDIANIQKTEMAPLDPGNLAVMAIYRQDTKTPAQFAVYQHEKEDNPWIAQNVTAPSFQLATWYHIKVQISDTTCRIKIWAEPQQEPGSWQTFSITKTPSQRVLGVISSGASIEYKFINPNQKPTFIPQLRDPKIVCNKTPCSDPSNPALTNAKELETIAKQVLTALQTISIGAFNLQAIDKPLILRGRYVYTTRDTKLTDANGNIIDDYVVACEIGTDNTATNYGKKPSTGDGIASLITNKVYDKNVNVVFVAANLFDVLTKTVGLLPDALTQTITNAQKAYAQNALAAPWGAFKLKAVSQTAITNSQYIYIMPMVNNKGAPIIDQQNKQLTDYFFFADTDQGSVGIPYSPTNKSLSLISVITNNKYDNANSYAPSDTLDDAYDIYTSNIGIPAADIDTAIKQTQQTYQAIISKAAPTATFKAKPGIIKATPSAIAQLPDIKQAPPAAKPVQPGKESLHKRSIAAAAGQSMHAGLKQ